MVMEKINVAELLKDCPSGMELDCTMFENVTFVRVDMGRKQFPIEIAVGGIRSKYLTKEGCFHDTTLLPESKCVIFPKGKTTWEGFVPLKDGDIVYFITENNNEYITIFKNDGNVYLETYVDVSIATSRYSLDVSFYIDNIKEQRLATAEEKQKLFRIIEDNGYKWNSETKTLEKLIKPKFRIEKSKWYVCTKDLLDSYANKAFRKGDIYYSPEDGYLIPSNSNVPSKVEYCTDEYFRDWTIQDAKDGDVLFHSDSASNGIFIFKEILQRGTIQKVICYCDYDSEDGFCLGKNHTCCWTDSKILHPATKEQCDFLFQKMKEAGYKWNSETKTLEELPKFKNGNVIVCENHWGPFISIFKENVPNRNGFIGHCVLDVDDNKFEVKDSASYYNKARFATKREKERLFVAIERNGYRWNEETNTLEKLIEPRFDITTLVPFKSEVLVRNDEHQYWIPAFWGFKRKNDYTTTFGWCRYCIPYKGNEHLLGTTDDCEERFKTWK